MKRTTRNALLLFAVCTFCCAGVAWLQYLRVHAPRCERWYTRYPSLGIDLIFEGGVFTAALWRNFADYQNRLPPDEKLTGRWTAEAPGRILLTSSGVTLRFEHGYRGIVYPNEEPPGEIVAETLVWKSSSSKSFLDGIEFDLTRPDLNPSEVLDRSNCFRHPDLRRCLN